MSETDIDPWHTEIRGFQVWTRRGPLTAVTRVWGGIGPVLGSRRCWRKNAARQHDEVCTIVRDIIGVRDAP